LFTVEQRNALEFRPAGPRFQLLFGETALDEPEASAPVARRLFIRTPAVAGDIFGVGRHLCAARTSSSPAHHNWPSASDPHHPDRFNRCTRVSGQAL